MKYSLSLVVTAYNEEELLESFIQKSMDDLGKVSDDYEIVLVNDGSKDNTIEIAKKLVGRYPNLVIVDLKENIGTGPNYTAGLAVASKEIFFWNTVDGKFDTRDLPLLLPYLDDYDVVSGYRSDLKGNTFYQNILTVCNLYLIRMLFGLKLKAYQTIQFHRMEFIRRITLENNSSFVCPELLIKANAAGKTIKEVEITFHGRRAGKATGGRLSFVMRSLIDVFKFWLLWRVLGRMKVYTK
ncbi:MAG: glycosyltransferase [Dehalococcoidia bacterium]|nr:glycosyltransferase [Dehalococcoidia bacterium]MDD5493141.1 glycosyltransferase [Dehalococcoidia bacterium]